jgi:hypothetical protein
MIIVQFLVKGRMMMLIMGDNEAVMVPLKSRRRKPGWNAVSSGRERLTFGWNNSLSVDNCRNI